THTSPLLPRATLFPYTTLFRSPSYVIGGKGMKVIQDEKQLERMITRDMTEAAFPILIDAYYPGTEMEVDVVTDGEKILIPAIFEHVEKAGVHSGDSMAVTPPVTLSDDMKNQVATYAEKIAKGMKFTGVFNIQFVLYNKALYVLEVNPRASRTVPVTSKVTNVNLIELATKTLLGEKLANETNVLLENEF